MVALFKPANLGYLDNCFGLGGLKIEVKVDVDYEYGQWFAKFEDREKLISHCAHLF